MCALCQQGHRTPGDKVIQHSLLCLGKNLDFHGLYMLHYVIKTKPNQNHLWLLSLTNMSKGIGYLDQEAWGKMLTTGQRKAFRLVLYFNSNINTKNIFGSYRPHWEQRSLSGLNLTYILSNTVFCCVLPPSNDRWFCHFYTQATFYSRLFQSDALKNEN